MTHIAAISTFRSNLKDRISEASSLDDYYEKVKGKLQHQYVKQKWKEFQVKEDGILFHKEQVYVHDSRDLRRYLL